MMIIWWPNHIDKPKDFFFWYAWICHIGPGFVGLVCWNLFGLRTCPEGHVELAGGLCKGEGAGLVERNVSREAITMMDMVCHTDDWQKYCMRKVVMHILWLFTRIRHLLVVIEVCGNTASRDATIASLWCPKDHLPKMAWKKGPNQKLHQNTRSSQRPLKK